MLLPSVVEIRRAFSACAEDGPIPLAEIVDRTPLLRDYVEGMMARCKEVHAGEYVSAKTQFVAGLALGIKIGEGR